MTKRTKRFGLALAICVGLGSLSTAEEMPLPPDLQAALFKKIFEYDRDLVAAENLVVLVTHNGDRFEMAEVIVEAFREADISAVSVAAADLSGELAESSVVYVTDGVDVGEVQSLCASRGILSVSGYPALAESGSVAVGIGVHEQKPQILVHLERLRIEGHQLAAELLSLARVIR